MSQDGREVSFQEGSYVKEQLDILRKLTEKILWPRGDLRGSMIGTDLSSVGMRGSSHIFTRVRL